MSFLSDAEYESMSREAEERLRGGEMDEALGLQTRLVELLMAPGPKAFRSQPAQAERLSRAADQLVDMLRWKREYLRALALQEQLAHYLPARQEQLRLSAATLRLESGSEAEAGLAQFVELAAQYPDNYWYQVSLGSAYQYLERFDEAERQLLRAAAMTGVRKIDRALAYQYLFHIYRRQEKLEEALAAWREAGRLDSSLRLALLPAVCRMLINAKKLAEARRHIGFERVPVRKTLLQGLVAFAEEKPGEAASAWYQAMTAFDPTALKEGLEEYAEICLRMGNPAAAILALESPGAAEHPSCQRSVLLGLAYAQTGNLGRTQSHLEVALRLGDLERPRQTLPGGSGRLLPADARDLFNSIFMPPSVRQRIETYFSMPDLPAQEA